MMQLQQSVFTEGNVQVNLSKQAEMKVFSFNVGQV